MMKKIWIGAGLVLLALLATVSFFWRSGQTSSTKKVVVATAGDIRPFSYEKDGELTGYDIEVIKAASAYMDGYDFSFTKTAWESIFVGMDSGYYQAAANNLSYTKERASKYFYSLPIATNPLVLVTAKGSSITNLDDIAGKTTQDDTGTSTAKLVEDWNKDHTANPSIIDYSGEDVAKRLLDLESGEFDYLIFDKISVETIIQQQGLELQVTELDSSANPNNYIVFADDSQDLQEDFDQALKTLYENGKLEELSQEYLGGSYLPEASQLGLN